MAYSNVRDYLKSTLQGVTGIGTVHDYFRLLRSKKEIKDGLVSSSRLNAWFIRKTGEINTYEGPGYLLKTHVISLIGVMSIDDADITEKTFLTLVTNIIHAIQSNYTFGGIGYQSNPPTLSKHRHQKFANILCHYAVIQVNFTERLSV